MSDQLPPLFVIEIPNYYGFLHLLSCHPLSVPRKTVVIIVNSLNFLFAYSTSLDFPSSSLVPFGLFKVDSLIQALYLISSSLPRTLLLGLLSLLSSFHPFPCYYLLF